MRYLIPLLLLLLLIMAILCAGYAAAHMQLCGAASTDLDTYGGSQFTTVAIPTLLEFPKEYAYTDTETGAEKTHRSLTQFYMQPESDQQIRAVVQHGSIEDYGRLLTLLHKFWHGSREELLALTTLKDSDAYATIAKYWRRMPSRSSEGAERIYMAKASAAYAQIKRHARSPKTLLDIGCGTGYIAAALGRLLNVETHGVDFQATNDSGIRYKQLGESTRLPYEDGSMDIIVINMVLHHVDDIRTMVHEIGRVLTPDGILYIADHDCWDAIDAMLVDIEHQLYKNTVDRKNDESQSEREFKIYRYSNYYGWDEHFKGVLECIDADFIYPQLKNSMGASRQFWGIFVKPGTRKSRWSKT
jgi:ubiquinone/menaquinone biosynthesis C-methylase UbiE